MEKLIIENNRFNVKCCIIYSQIECHSI